VGLVVGRREGVSHWFEALADHMGPAYLRYSFTKGTEQEVEALVDLLGLGAGCSILDVGCGPGRHSLALASRGHRVVGLDVSATFVRIAADAAERAGLSGARFVRGDARGPALPPEVGDGGFDAVLCLCQGGFGLMDVLDDDLAVMGTIARSLRPGGVAAVSGFSAYFAVRHHVAAEFDAATGTCSERTTIHDPQGAPKEVDLTTGCFTPREMRLMAERVGLEVLAIYGVEPGAYGRSEPSVDLAELLLVARRPL
jgi:SAM-dependent methyltransferase